MTTRLSMSSLAGTARTLVAVGTVSEVSMLDTTRDGAPRSGVTMSSLTGPVPLTAGTSRGFGASAVGSLFGSACGSLFAAGAALASACGSLLAAGAAGVGLRGRLAGVGAFVAAGAPLRRAVGGRRRLGARGGRRCWRRGAWSSGASSSCAPGPHPRRPRPVGSPRRNPTRPCRPTTCRSGTAGRARRRAIRSARTLQSGHRTWTDRTRRMRLFRLAWERRCVDRGQA